MELTEAEITQDRHNLTQAMAEIEAVVVKYDVGATVTLSSGHHAEFKIMLDTTDSIVHLNNETGELTIKATEEMFDSKDEQITATTKSTARVLGMREISYKIYRIYSDIAKVFEKKFEIDFDLEELDEFTKPSKPH